MDSRPSRKGITPVIAVVLLMSITVAGSVSLYMFFKDSATKASSDRVKELNGEIKAVNAECERRESKPDRIHILLRNNGASLDGDAGIYLYHDSGKPYLKILGQDWSDEDFARPGGSGTVTIPTSLSEEGKDLKPGESYIVKVRLSSADKPLNAGVCHVSSKDPEDETGGPADTSPPSVSNDYSGTGWHKTSQTVELRCEDKSGCSIDWRLYDSEGGLLNQGDSLSSPTTVKVGESAEGELKLEYRATDGEGNTADWSPETVKVDKTPPSTSITDPSASPTYSSTFTVKVEDSDSEALKQCSYMIDGGSWQDRSCGTGFDVDIGSGGDCETDGGCEVEVKAEDKAGRTDTDTRTYTVETAGDLKTRIVGPPTSRVYSDDFTVTVNDQATDRELAKCEYLVKDAGDSSGWKTRTCEDGVFEVSVGSSGDCGTVGADSCEVQTRVVDSEGNQVKDSLYYTIGSYTPVTFDENETVELEDTPSNISWYRKHSFELPSRTVYGKKLGIGQRFNISIYGTSDEPVNSMVCNYQPQVFSYDTPLMRLASIADTGRIQYRITGFTHLGNGSYSLYRDGSKIKELSEGGTLSWTNNDWDSGHSFEIMPERE